MNKEEELTTEELNKQYDAAMSEFLAMGRQFDETGFFTAEDKELAEGKLNSNQTNIE